MEEMSVVFFWLILSALVEKKYFSFLGHLDKEMQLITDIFLSLSW